MATQRELNIIIRAKDKASKILQRYEKDFQKLEQAGKGVFLAGAAGALGLGFMVKKAADFEQEMDKVAAISGATEGGLNRLRDAALKLGASTPKSASEVAKAMEGMAAKGYEVNQIIKAMPGIISASVASGESLASVSDVVSSALNGFKLKASDATHVADVLAMAANKSAAKVSDLGFAFKYAAPVANTLGYSMESLAAATGIMVDAGMQGEQAGTTLRMALIRMSNPTKKARAAMDALGLSFVDANGNMKPLGNIVKQLAAKTKNMGNAQKLAAFATIFGTEAASGMLNIVAAGPKKFNSMTKALQRSSGTSSKVAKVMRDNLKGALDEMSGAWETVSITVGNAFIPIVRKAANILKSVADWFNKLNPNVQRNIALAAGAAAAFALIVGPLLLLVGLLPTLASGFALLFSPVGLIVGAIIGLIAVFVLAYAKIDWFRKGVNKAFAFIKNIVMQMLGAAVNFIKSQITVIQQWWKQHGQAIEKIMKVAWKVITAIFKVAFAIVKTIVLGTWKNIKGIISGAINVILGVIGFFADLLTGNWKALWGDVKQIFRGLWEFVWNYIQLILFGKVLKIVGRFAGKALGVIGGWIGGMVKSVRGLGSRVMGAISRAFNWVKNKIYDVVTGIAVKISGWRSKIGDLFFNMVHRIRTAMSSVWDTLTSPFRRAYNWIKDIPGKIKRLFRSLKINIPTPHFSFETHWKNLPGPLPSIPVPDIDINWYKTGGIFDRASVIGVGEAGPEAVLPLAGSRMKPFADAVARIMSRDFIAMMNRVQQMAVPAYGYALPQVAGGETLTVNNVRPELHFHFNGPMTGNSREWKRFVRDEIAPTVNKEVGKTVRRNKKI